MKNTCRDNTAFPQRHRLAQALFLAFGLATVTGFAPLSAFAQETAAAGSSTEKLNAVTVTARKVNEELLDVPISIQAFSEKQLRESGTFDLYDLKNIAGFNFTTFTSSSAGRSNGVIVFRGLQGGTGLVNENSGSLFIDGIFISSGQASVNTVDVARVEVLKGPQNAFFGRSTFGGAVNFITRIPSQEFGGVINSSFTSRGTNDIDATLEGALLPNLLSGRLTVYNHDKAALFKASDGGDLGAEKSRGLTTTLYATPTDKLWIRARANFQKDDDSTPAYGLIQAGSNSSCVGKFQTNRDLSGNPISYQTGVPFFCGTVPTIEQTGSGVVDANTNLPATTARQLSSNFLNDQLLSRGPKLDHSGFVRNATRVSLQAGLDLPYDANLVVNAGYNQSGQVAAYDLDASTANNFYSIQTILSHDTTLDARLSTSRNQPLRGLIGASYFEQVYQLSQDDLNAYAGATVQSLNTSSFTNNKSKVPALYGNIEYDILPNLTISGDGRYQKDKITALSYFGDQRYTSEKSNFLPRLTLSYKPVDGLMIYASAAKGVQPLTLNSGYISSNAAQRAFFSSQINGASEFTPQPKLNSYEVGVKQRLLDDRVAYSLSVFNSRWDNRLTLATLFNPPSCVAAGTQNTPACPLGVGGVSAYLPNDAKIKGAEFSLDAVVVKNLLAGLNVAYTEARWSNFYFSTVSSQTAAALNTKAYYFPGRELAKVPKWSGNLYSTYRVPGLYQSFDGYVRADAFYTGSSWAEDFNYAKDDAFWRVNFRAGLENKGVTVEAFVKNAFNDKHWLYAYRAANLALTPLTSFSQQAVAVQPGDPREVGVRLSYRF